MNTGVENERYIYSFQMREILSCLDELVLSFHLCIILSKRKKSQFLYYEETQKSSSGIIHIWVFFTVPLNK